jgi:hypothetical protein
MKWVSTKERLPENELLVLLYVPNTFVKQQVRFGYFFTDRSGRTTAELVDDGGLDTIHLEDAPFWMPLPDPPKELK